MPASLQKKGIFISVMRLILFVQTQFIYLWKIQVWGFRRNAKKKYSTVSIR